MKRISRSVFALKWFLPLIFILVGVVGPAAIWASNPERIPVSIFLGPLLMLAIGFVLMKQLVLGLADDVRDGGDYLLVRKGRIEERVPLSNIMNVSASTMVNPPRIELRLVEPNRLGDRIVFSPTRGGTLNPFARNAIAEDLMVRVDRARANRKR